MTRQLAITFMAQGGAENESRFLQVARVLASLVHPHIVVLLDLGCHKEAPYLVMEYLPGFSLVRWIKGPEPMEKSLG